VTLAGRPKTLNNGSTNSHPTFICVPQSLKTHLQKKPKTSPKHKNRLKTIFNLFLFLNQACVLIKDEIWDALGCQCWFSSYLAELWCCFLETQFGLSADLC